MNEAFGWKREGTTIKAFFNQSSIFSDRVLACKLIIEEEYAYLQLKQQQHQINVQEDANLARLV